MNTQKLIEVFASKIVVATQIVEEFRDGLAQHSWHAMEWGDAAVEASAKIKVFKTVLKNLQLEGVTADDVLNDLKKDLTNLASSPARSTSKMTEMIHLFEVKATADAIELFAWRG